MRLSAARLLMACATLEISAASSSKLRHPRAQKARPPWEHRGHTRVVLLSFPLALAPGAGRVRLKGWPTMNLLSGLRIGLLVMAGLFGAAPVAHAADGAISIRIIKAGFVVGGSAGEGVLTFQGRRYPLSIGGLSYGFTFGASETRFRGTVRNIRRASDISGVYAQGGAGAAVKRGAQVIVLTNQNGATLEMSGAQTGLIVSLDLSGLALSLK